MGKCKKRFIAKAKNEKDLLQMTRVQAINEIMKSLNEENHIDARNIISLFGITAEELAEAGISYETLRALDSVVN